MVTRAERSTKQRVGGYFVANYPPFSVWTADAVSRRVTGVVIVDRPWRASGLYCTCLSAESAAISATSASIPTRTRRSRVVLDVMAREWEIYNTFPAMNGCPLNYVYFGGGTPSFLSVRQLTGLVQRLTAVASWKTAGDHVRMRARYCADRAEACGHSRSRRDAAQSGSRISTIASSN